MLVSENEALTRLASPLNLINRLRSSSSRQSSGAMNLFVPSNAEPVKPKHFNPFPSSVPSPINQQADAVTVSVISDNANQAPTIDNLIHDADSRIKLESAHNKALEVLTDAVDMMKLKLDDIKPDKLPSVITATSKVVESIRRERLEATRNNGNKQVNIVFYTPIQKTIDDYETVEVG